MALIKCPKCGSEVSDRAEKCVKCGARLKEPAQAGGSGVTTDSGNAAFNPNYGAGFSLWSGFVSGWKKYAVIKGRARRKEFGGWYLLNIVLVSVLTILILEILGFREEFANSLFNLYMVAMIVPSITIAIRRLHDIDHSGWALVWAFVPLVGFFILLFLLARKGSFGKNSYGEDPKGDPIAD